MIIDVQNPKTVSDGRGLIMPHQDDALKALDRYFNLDNPTESQAGIVVMPTGSGKIYTAVTWLLQSCMCHGVLNFTKKYSKQALEETCRQALELGRVTYTFIKNTIPVVAESLGVSGYNTAVNVERNKGAFVMDAGAMDINRILSRSQILAQGKGRNGGK